MADGDEIAPIRPLALHDVALPLVQEYRTRKMPLRVIVPALALRDFEFREEAHSFFLTFFFADGIEPVGQGRPLLLKTGLAVPGNDLAIQPIRPFRLRLDKGAVVVMELPELERLCLVVAGRDSRAEPSDADRIGEVLLRNIESLAGLRSILSLADMGVLAEHADKPVPDEEHGCVDDGRASIFLCPANLRETFLSCMHRRMAGGAEADKVLRRIGAAFAFRQDVVKMLDRLAAQGAPAVLQGGDIVLLACVAFQASVLEVPATNRPVLEKYQENLRCTNSFSPWKHGVSEDFSIFGRMDSPLTS